MKYIPHRSSPLLLFIILLGLWEATTSQSPRLHFLFAAPTEIWASLIRNTVNGSLLFDALITGFEALVGFVFGIIFGSFVGFILWYSPFMSRLLRPYLIILGAVPIFAFAPMIIIWFGIGLNMKIAMATLGAFLVALTQAQEGANSINLEEFRLLKIFGATRIQIFQKTMLPSLLSWLLTSMKLCSGFALLGAFIGEYISSDKGLGHFMIRAGSLYDMPSVFAGSIYLVMIALLFNLFIDFFNKNKEIFISHISVGEAVKQALKTPRSKL